MTVLSVTGVPGAAHVFTVKRTGTPHLGLTALSVLGTPGRRDVFTVKQVSGGQNTRLDITALSATGTPGRRDVFTTKRSYAPSTSVPVPPQQWISGGFGYQWPNEPVAQVVPTRYNDDDEVLEILTLFTQSGVLDEWLL